MSMVLRSCCAFLLLAASVARGAFFSPGDVARLTQGEMLLFQGKNFLPAPKGQEFTVLKFDARANAAYVAYYKEDGSLIAVTLPGNVLEPAPANAWADLLRGAEAFREGRLDEARRFLAKAGLDPQYRALAGGIVARVTGAIAAVTPAGRQALPAVAQGLRETAAELAKQGYLCLAVPLDEGTDRLTQDPALGSKINRAELAKQVATSQRAVIRVRQAIALKRLVEAKKYLQEGLEAEPSRPELKAVEAKLLKDLKEADDSYEAADRMRRFANGTPHALTAMERGMKACSDHPRLIALRKELQGAFEERTAPPVTPALLAATGTKTSLAPLEEGRKLYTTRCTECHDLELLDSRSPAGWERAVAGMAGRAKLSDPQKARIMEYITVAWNAMDGK